MTKRASPLPGARHSSSEATPSQIMVRDKLLTIEEARLGIVLLGCVLARRPGMGVM